MITDYIKGPITLDSLQQAMNFLMPEVDETVFKALSFAFDAHDGIVRKYTGEPYIVHPFDVASMVYCARGTTRDVVAALLHDVVEDCDVTVSDIEHMFGDDVASDVQALTEFFPEAANRAEKKVLYTAQLVASRPGVHTIKLADLVSNVPSIVEHDRNFAKVYLVEKKALFEAISPQANWIVRIMAKNTLADAEEALMDGNNE